MISWLPELKVCYVPPKKIAELDPPDLAFWNLNTPLEFLQAEQRAWLESH
jgi:hypothetical protein